MLPSNKFAANEVICKKKIGLDKHIKIKNYEAPAHCRLRACNRGLQSLSCMCVSCEKFVMSVAYVNTCL